MNSGMVLTLGISVLLSSASWAFAASHAEVPTIVETPPPPATVLAYQYKMLVITELESSQNGSEAVQVFRLTSQRGGQTRTYKVVIQLPDGRIAGPGEVDSATVQQLAAGSNLSTLDQYDMATGQRVQASSRRPTASPDKSGDDVGKSGERSSGGNDRGTPGKSN